jgi:hypothetical protein
MPLAEQREQQPSSEPAPAPAPAPRPQARPVAAGPVQQGEPQPAGPVADNVFAPRVPVPPQVGEPGEPGSGLTLDVAVEALMAFQEAFRHDPDEERLAQYLFTEYGVSGRRPGSPASRSEMARLWPQLQDRYATLGRD